MRDLNRYDFNFVASWPNAFVYTIRVDPKSEILYTHTRIHYKFLETVRSYPRGSAYIFKPCNLQIYSG